MAKTESIAATARAPRTVARPLPKKKADPRALTLDDGQLRNGVRNTFAHLTHPSVLKHNAEPLFRTNVKGLWTVFLRNLPPRLRKTYVCHACRQFADRFGGLVTIDPMGKTVPVVWHEGDVPAVFKPAVKACREFVRGASVSGVYLDARQVWGTPQTGQWAHLAVDASHLPFRPTKTRNAGQAMAEKSEDFKILTASLSEFSWQVAANAVAALKDGRLYRAEKVEAVSAWFLDVHQRIQGKKGRARTNLIWAAAASAPPGFCHIRSTMLGTLLEDLAAKMPFEAVAERWTKKMAPTMYQRPQARPTAGNIDRAEKIVEQLGIAPSLRRRYARLEDLQRVLWTPKGSTRRAGVGVGVGEGEGVFSHLRGEVEPFQRESLPEVTLTWEKFARTVLPTAEKIEVGIPTAGLFIALCTAADPLAPPLLQWDFAANRNPVSWYVYPKGSTARMWSLTPGTWGPVTAVTPLPHLWHDPEAFKQHGQGVVLCLEGAHEREPHYGGGLFPELLRGELREVRATIEAHAKTSLVEGREEATACGLDIRAGSPINANLRVTSGGVRSLFLIDRWD